MRKVKMDEHTEECTIDLFGEDGKWHTYALRENVIVDAEKLTAQRAFESLRSQKESIVRFKANNKDIITEVDTLADGDEETDENRMKFAWSGNVEQSWKGGIWFRSDKGFRFADDAVLFQVPEKRNKQTKWGMYFNILPEQLRILMQAEMATEAHIWVILKL